MNRVVRALIFSLLVGVVACPPPDGPPNPPIFIPPTQEIGTWPTPEINALGEEKCDGLDNDGDGSVDEGCSCTENRGCVLVTAESTCLAGTQVCSSALAECAGPGTDLGAAQTAGITTTSVTPNVLTALDATGPVVIAEVRPSCTGIRAPYVVVLLEASVPAMRVWAIARDDGLAPDAAGEDGLYSAALINPFGPGVPTQTMTVEVGVRLDEEWLLDQTPIDFQAD